MRAEDRHLLKSAIGTEARDERILIDSFPIRPEEQLTSPVDPALSDVIHPKQRELESKLTDAIDAIKGTQSIIEQLYGDSVVQADDEAKRAIKRVFGVDTDQITFEMYQRAVRMREALLSPIRQKVIEGAL